MDNPSSVASCLLQFIAASPTPYHAVASAVSRLAETGFQLLDERASWSELAPGRYCVNRGDSALVAFVVPGSRDVGGFRIVGAHTDSPNLRLKPNAEYTKEGYRQLGVEVYGGALLNSWLDRDLSLAGRVLVREDDGLVSRLLRIDRPLLRIPQLAVHLDRDVNDRGLVLNRQEHMAPVLGLASNERGGLTALCARELGVPEQDITAMDLMLFEVTAPTVAGIDGEFIYAPRLDNLAMCHAAVMALAHASAHASDGDLVPMAVLFDHEEVGSHSAYGAASPLLPAVCERIVLALGKTRDGYHRTIARSLCISADMAHAVHPNYIDRHEARHRPHLNGGPVIKINTQQRYATCAHTAALVQELCRREEVPVQYYAHRTDLPCGSTIGPITASLLGIRTVDIGSPMLSMHSAREMAGAKDPELMTRVMARFFVGR